MRIGKAINLTIIKTFHWKSSTVNFQWIDMWSHVTVLPGTLIVRLITWYLMHAAQIGDYFRRLIQEKCVLFSLIRYCPPYCFVFSFLDVFYFLPYVFVILYKVRFVPELESEAKDAFREFLGTAYPDWSDRFESFLNEWKMTYTSNGPFETEHDRTNINEKMTHPDDFQVWRIVLPQIRARLIWISTKCRVRSVRTSAQLGVTLKYTPQAEAYFFEICTSVLINN